MNDIAKAHIGAGHNALQQPALSAETLAKEERLRALFREMCSVLVAFSGGVDSTYVAYVANAELGDRCLAVTGDSPSVSHFQRTQYLKIAGDYGLRHEVIRTDELSNPNYQANAPDRCFFCKDELYGKLANIVDQRAMSCIVDGSTTDDVKDFRPGRKAASEHGVRSPLIEVGLSKNEVRQLSKRAGLPTWDQPASPCLSSRIAYGTTVTIERLSSIDRGEQIMRELGFREFRVRHHDSLVRIEVAPEELNRALQRDIVDAMAERFQRLGFKYVTLDLRGYRSGAMNEVLNIQHSTAMLVQETN